MNPRSMILARFDVAWAEVKANANNEEEAERVAEATLQVMEKMITEALGLGWPDATIEKMAVHAAKVCMAEGRRG